MAQQIVAVSDAVFVIREGSTKGIAVRCFRGAIFVLCGFLAIIANPSLHLVAFRGPHSVLTNLGMAYLAAMSLAIGCRELLFWRSICLDLVSREIECRYGLFFDFWVAFYRFDDFDSVEVALSTRTRRRAPYRVFLKPIWHRRKIEIDEYYDGGAAKGFAEQLSGLMGIPTRDQVQKA
jgi:hypothetical protein